MYHPTQKHRIKIFIKILIEILSITTLIVMFQSLLKASRIWWLYLLISSTNTNQRLQAHYGQTLYIRNLLQHNISLSFSSTIRKIDTPNPISLTDLKDGDVLLCVAIPNDCVSWAITYFTNAEVSHAALTYDAKNNVLVDAAGNHVRTALITDYLNDGRPIHVMRYQYNQNLKPVLASAKNFLDKQEPYANSTLVMLAAVLLLTKNIPGNITC